ncbi:Hydrogenase isoenzymes nickel incorporation protein HypB [Aquicella siphonis]|uniref:Hydrogenase maturation factor HypB n=1 Tax=Aquicella siphonis TaxID=254247 RepID=A0A5E4PEX2_9COXI|nr:hydrogenase nickel incorporation protein HypB [Aquicella siphonis]VVC75530.1 Hydrogenase isoenzymes nickel incorporation protein HypB [Aquicella siphonis]
MCGICGCSENNHDMAVHSHGDSAMAVHAHDDHEWINIEKDIFSRNNHFARQNQDFFSRNRILAINMMSSPGSGKTTLLAKTISALKENILSAVIVGDQQTEYDAAVIEASGAPAVQINTGKVCHLDAHMIGHAVEKLPLRERMVLFIENIGNLVCPAHFHLGEHYKIVVLSVAEGDNKPLKYPDMFRFADLMILTKTDLLPYVEFDVDKCMDYARRIRPGLEVIALSANNGQGLTHWYQWLMQKQK